MGLVSQSSPLSQGPSVPSVPSVPSRTFALILPPALVRIPTRQSVAHLLRAVRVAAVRVERIKVAAGLMRELGPRALVGTLLGVLHLAPDGSAVEGLIDQTGVTGGELLLSLTLRIRVRVGAPLVLRGEGVGGAVPAFGGGCSTPM